MKKLFIIFLFAFNYANAQTYQYQTDSNALMDNNFLFYTVVVDSNVIPFVDYRHVYTYNSKSNHVNKTMNCGKHKIWVSFDPTVDTDFYIISRNDEKETYKLIIKLCNRFCIIFVHNGEVYKTIMN